MVPPELRAERTEALNRAAASAAKPGTLAICADQGVEFWFETGEQTPITLLRAIEDTGAGDLRIGLDPADLLTSGNALA